MGTMVDPTPTPWIYIIDINHRQPLFYLSGIITIGMLPYLVTRLYCSVWPKETDQKWLKYQGKINDLVVGYRSSTTSALKF